MSATQLAKRALVVLLLAFARVYHLDLKLNRDSADTDVKKGFRRVIVKAHPDKPGGSEAHTKALNAAWAKWLAAGRSAGKAGRPSKANSNGNADAAGDLAESGGKRKKGYHVNAVAVMLTYQGIDSVDDWQAFVDFVVENKFAWKVKHWTATFESNADGSLHAHLMLEFFSEQDKSTNGFSFKGLRPNASVNDLCGNGLKSKRPQQSRDRGHFYVWANKVGTQVLPDGSLCVAANYEPCWTQAKIRYQVLGKWPEELWKQHKLSSEAYEDYLFSCRDGVPFRKRNLEVCVEREKAKTRKREMEDRAQRIRSNPLLYRPFPEVPAARAWLQLFLQDALRYPIMIVRGRSHTGKTEWAKSLFKKPLELKVGALAHFPDKMREFDRSVHDGIILDDVRDLLFLGEHQDKLQGKYDTEVEFASTAGGTCAYARDLFCIPVVVTVNNSTKNFDALETHDWLGHPQNRVLVDWPVASF